MQSIARRENAMGSLQLINSISAWERKLEQERRKNHRSEPYVNYLAAPQPCRKEQQSLFARIFQHRRENQAPASSVEALTNLSFLQ
jgi:hypothetical protein